MPPPKERVQRRPLEGPLDRAPKLDRVVCSSLNRSGAVIAAAGQEVHGVGTRKSGVTFNSKLCVLITSTLEPRGADSEQIRLRRDQYECALRSWLQHPDPRVHSVVYCDNSTPSLDWTYAVADEVRTKKGVESIHCPDNRIPDGMHYGYPELGIIDHSLRTSLALEQADYFVKVTGRLQFPRLSRLLDRLPQSFDACIDYRRAYKAEDKSWSRFRARTQLMFFRTGFYRQRMMNTRSTMLSRSISHIEEFIPGILAPTDPTASGCVFRWPIECPPSGLGGNGVNFDSMGAQLKSFARDNLRRFASSLWL